MILKLASPTPLVNKYIYVHQISFYLRLNTQCIDVHICIHINMRENNTFAVLNCYLLATL